MIAWLDAYWLPVMLLVPLAGALFLLSLPNHDRLTLRHVGVWATSFSVALACWGIWRQVQGIHGVWRLAPWGVAERSASFSLGPEDVPVLLIVSLCGPICLRGGAPRIAERTQGFVALMLLLQSLSLACVVVQEPLYQLLLLTVATMPQLLLLALFGGPFRGSAALRVGLLWVSADLIAIAGLMWLLHRAGALPFASAADVARGMAMHASEAGLPLSLALFLPGLVRLAVFPLGLWLPAFREEAPVAGLAWWAGAMVPLGGMWLADISHAASVATEARAALAAALGLSAALAGLIASVERDLRRLASGGALFHAALASAALVAGASPAAVLVYLAAAAISALWALFVTDALERRYYSRDAAELVGLAGRMPGLWWVCVLSLLALLGVPFIGGGSMLLATLERGMRAAAGLHDVVRPTAALVWLAALAFGWLGLAAGIAGALTRLVTPLLRRAAGAPEPPRLPQVLRLWVPGLVALLFGLAGPSLARLLDRAGGPAEARDTQVPVSRDDAAPPDRATGPGDGAPEDSSADVPGEARR